MFSVYGLNVSTRTPFLLKCITADFTLIKESLLQADGAPVIAFLLGLVSVKSTASYLINFGSSNSDSSDSNKACKSLDSDSDTDFYSDF